MERAGKGCEEACASLMRLWPAAGHCFDKLATDKQACSQIESAISDTRYHMTAYKAEKLVSLQAVHGRQHLQSKVNGITVDLSSCCASGIDKTAKRIARSTRLRRPIT